MGQVTDQILARLKVPTAAQYVVIFDQAAHLDWDWIRTFDEYFLTAYSGYGVNGALLSALELLGKNNGNEGPYYYSICEMGYLQKFISYQAEQGNDVVSQFQAAGQSFRIVGGGITSPDNLVCAGEAFIRSYLMGRVWLGQVFPDLLPLKHCWIPDDFGQDPELPVAVQAMGLISIAFARLPGTAPAFVSSKLKDQLLQNGVDFFWQSSDPGSKVYTHWLQGGYPQGSGIDDNPSTQQPDPKSVLPNMFGYLASNNLNGSGYPPYSAAPTNYVYVPIDNDFMMPVSDLLGDMKEWNTSTSTTLGYNTTGVYAVEASFDDFVSLVLDNSGHVKTVAYNGTPYWTGYYMSRPAMKILHYDAVRWLLSAEVFGLLASAGDYLDPLYWQRLTQAWTDFLPSAHHDYVCGTANDWVYQLEQLPLLQTAHGEARRVAHTALQALGSSIGAVYGETPVVIANPAGVAHNGIVELPGPVPSGINGIQFDDLQTNNLAQPTAEGGLVFLASVQSLGYTTGYLTSTEGTISTKATISPQQSGQLSYTLQNEYLTVVIDAGSNWGIQSVVDSNGNSLLASNGLGNDLVFYEDGGDIYEFGNEYVSNDQTCFQSQQVAYETSGAGLGATVLEEGPVRVRLQTVVSVQVSGSAYIYTREYALVSGEPFLRMKTTGAAPSGYSVMTAFPLSAEVNTIVHGTACHWTSVQPLTLWDPPVFQSAHRFLLPQAESTILGAVYHRDVPAWAFSGASDKVLPPGVLIGCLLRNTPGGPHGAKGSDNATHTLHYAFRIYDGLGDPASGQPLSEALNYTMPAVAALINTIGIAEGSPAVTLPESGFLASIDSPGVILAAKPGDVSPETMVLRLYQPTNSNASQTLSVTLGTGQPSQVTAVTALEDPIANAPVIPINENGFTIDVTTALNTVAITPARQRQETKAQHKYTVGSMHEITILPERED
ncbi:MAG TPA: hypothetical protein VN937_07420 [Blastocatellia bacterium]|nr:hypothetical protein [Blastocatellia bacterium]